MWIGDNQNIGFAFKRNAFSSIAIQSMILLLILFVTKDFF